MYDHKTGIRDVLTRATGTGWEAAYRQDVGWLLERVGELEATLANERGEGEGPEGWASQGGGDGPRWSREIGTEGGGTSDLMVWRDVLRVGRFGIHPWVWSVMVAPDSESDMVEAARGDAPTAREAMRAADAALRSAP